MLTRSGLAAAIVAALQMLPVTTAFADSGPGNGQVQVTSDEGGIDTQVTDPGAPGSVQQQVSKDSGQTADSCQWMQVFVFERLPLPDPANAHGTWWQQYCNGNGWKGVPVFVPDASGAAPVSPATLAQDASNRLPLPSPTAAHNPSGDAMTNLAVWWWIPRSQWEPLTQQTQAGAVWARVTAEPMSTTWDAGDGTASLVCDGPGTPYDTSRPASEQSTDCSHTYTRSSAGQPQSGPRPNDRYFTVTVTVTWQVTWVGAAGSRGALPPITRTSTFPLSVDDRETVVTGGSG